ncbi:uncharacterized protein DUF2219 [Chitinophaga polysaccharea]|uniref:Uncharacterized protein DUF2219 n=1 Tax=Chitinophaga polysaccharea TaxID=1293035 RepID=A0A561Q2D3_9BACT|nr:lipid A deacylase LpxR family protein [Chitinophaga polysaccharea]TWF44528.1 uncharacterized protein DUF2219 [Chitinophaga polysaccharea]
MKCCIIWLLLCVLAETAPAQITQDATKQIRIYEDDDYFNLWGRGTDRAYSNGSAIGYSYMKKKPSVFLDKWILPQAGPNAINVFSWQVMQVTMTPNDIAATTYQPDDFYYAGGLFVSHGLTSYNPDRKRSFHAEFLLGVMGPWALSKEGQTLVHHVINYQPPKGWSNQLPNAPLLNYNFTCEAMLWNPAKSLEVIGGGTARLGLMVNSVTASLYIRYGLINPYFGHRDLASATHRKFQLYIMARPQLNFVAYNALLQGGLFSSTDSQLAAQKAEQRTHMRMLVAGIDYGVGIVIKRTTIRYTQRSATEWMAGTRKHSVGNFTFLIPISRKGAVHHPPVL